MAHITFTANSFLSLVAWWLALSPYGKKVLGSIPTEAGMVAHCSTEVDGSNADNDFHSTSPFTCDQYSIFFSTEMLESNNLVTFEGLANSSSYHTFLLDEERGRLVVGAKDHIFSFNLLNVSRDYTQVQKQNSV